MTLGVSPLVPTLALGGAPLGILRIAYLYALAGGLGTTVTTDWADMRYRGMAGRNPRESVGTVVYALKSATNLSAKCCWRGTEAQEGAHEPPPTA